LRPRSSATRAASTRTPRARCRFSAGNCGAWTRQA
jgi:hypothetical protein